MIERCTTRKSRRKGGAPDAQQGEHGMALMIAVLMLLLLSGIAVSAIDHSGSDLDNAGHARSTAATFYAADAGLQVAIAQLINQDGDTSPIDIDLAGGRNVRSGPRDAGSAQDLNDLGAGPPPDGSCIELRPQCFRTQMYRSVVTGSGPDSAVELEAQLSIVRPGSGNQY
jgi:hypothetical protein